MSQLLEKLAARAAERRWNSLSEKTKGRMRNVDPSSAGWEYRRYMAKRVADMKKSVERLGGQTTTIKGADRPHTFWHQYDDGNWGSESVPGHNKTRDDIFGVRITPDRKLKDGRQRHDVYLYDPETSRAQGIHEYLVTKQQENPSLTNNDLSKMYYKNYLKHEANHQNSQSANAYKPFGWDEVTRLSRMDIKKASNGKIKTAINNAKIYKHEKEQEIRDHKGMPRDKLRREYRDSGIEQSRFNQFMKANGALRALHEFTEAREQQKEQNKYHEINGEFLPYARGTLGVGTHRSPFVLFEEADALRRAPKSSKNFMRYVRNNFETVIPHKFDAMTDEEKDRLPEAARKFPKTQGQLLGGDSKNPRYGRGKIKATHKSKAISDVDDMQKFLQNQSEKNPSRMRSVWFSRGAGKKEK